MLGQALEPVFQNEIIVLNSGPEIFSIRTRLQGDNVTGYQNLMALWHNEWWFWVTQPISDRLSCVVVMFPNPWFAIA